MGSSLLRFTDNPKFVFAIQDGITPLMLAVRHGREDTARVLIARSVQLNTVNKASVFSNCVYSVFVEIDNALARRGERRLCLWPLHTIGACASHCSSGLEQMQPSQTMCVCSTAVVAAISTCNAHIAM